MQISDFGGGAPHIRIPQSAIRNPLRDPAVNFLQYEFPLFLLHSCAMSSNVNGDGLVDIRDVHKHFTRGNERIDVLKGINLQIPKGDFLALMGPSGSGKTTLLNLIGGLDQPTGGAVEVNGVPVSTLGGSQLSKWRAQNIGFV